MNSSNTPNSDININEEELTTAAQPATTDTSSDAHPTRERNYIAFISYRHLPLDKEAAERVQKKIENYTIPKEFREEFGGKKFGHAFRDEDELPTSASLTDSIYYALDHSKFLVVICTPGLPQSKWCEAEIKYFLKTHDRDHVLAVLADGEPSESFSPYLLHDFDEDGNPISDIEPLAANIAGPNHTINKKALNKEIVRLYATFLGCPFDSLWQREKRARTNRLLSIAGLAIAILCVFLVVVLNKNAQIQEQNVQIAQQNAQLESQNEKIEEQNTELQSRLSTVLVDSGIAKLESHDITGALKDALSSMENSDPSIYDHRVGRLMSDTLCAYETEMLRSTIVYDQSTEIRQIRLAQDKTHMLLLDEVGVLRCLDLQTKDILWEQTTGSDKSEVYAQIPGDRVVYKSLDGVFCLSVTDGALLWSFPKNDTYGNIFQAVSEDGTIFAAVDRDDSRDALELVFLRTEDGSELGRVDLSDEEDFTPSFTTFDNPHTYAASFSDDNSRFVFGIYGKQSDSEDDVNRFYYVDMESFAKTRVGTSGLKYRSFYGIDIDPEDNSVFIAAYTNSHILTALCTNDGTGYQFNTNMETHSFSTQGGVMILDENFEINESRFLSCDGRIYVFSDNQMFIYNRADNILGNTYSMSGAIINAYWADRKDHVLEFITNDAYIIDYFMDYNEGKILSGIQGSKADQSVMSRACSSGNGSVCDLGSFYNISSDAPGRLYLVEFVSDPNVEGFHPATEDYDFSDYYDFLISDSSDLGFLIYDQNYVSTFNKRTGEIIKTAKFDNYMTARFLNIIDDEHILEGSDVYSMDGTVAKYTEPINVNGIPDYPYYSAVLSDGQVMHYDQEPLYGYHRISDVERSSLSTLESIKYVTVWFNGSPIEDLCDPEKAVLFFDDSRENVPIIEAGANGLILQYGRVVDIKDPAEKTYTVRENKELWLADALTGKVILIEDAAPSSGEFRPAFANKKHLFAAAYNNGEVYIYDVDQASARPLGFKYNADEIANLCFSDDDAYLLILTSSGRLDVYEASGLETMFSDKISLFQGSLLLSTYEMTAQKVGQSNCLFIKQNNSCVVLDIEGWTVISEFSGSSVVYDPKTERVFSKVERYVDSAHSGTDIVSYPIYDIAKLKEWAEKEVK